MPGCSTLIYGAWSGAPTRDSGHFQLAPTCASFSPATSGWKRVYCCMLSFSAARASSTLDCFSLLNVAAPSIAFCAAVTFATSPAASLV